MFKKAKIYSAYLIVPICTFILFGCKDIIEKDISKDTPVIILPAMNDTISSNPVHFKWEELSGATKYHLEVVSPSFNNIQIYAVDSIISSTNFYIDLDSNVYEYRLTALNAGYQSFTTTIRSFLLGTSAGSTSGGVLLNNPINNTYVNETFNGIFSWFALSNVSSYTFELHQGSTFAGSTLQYSDQLGTTSISSFNGFELDEGTFSWGVKAYLNDGSETVYTKRIFYLDTVNPGISAQSMPLNNSFQNSGLVLFSWNLPTDNGTVQSPLLSVLEISTNASFTSVLPPETVSGSSTSVNLGVGTYYWRVRMIDEAGNSGPTPPSSFVLNVIP